MREGHLGASRELIYGAYRLGAGADRLLERLDETLPPNLPALPFDGAAMVK